MTETERYMAERARSYRRMFYVMGALALVCGVTAVSGLVHRNWRALSNIAIGAFAVYQCFDCRRRAACFARGEWPA